jgi:hypothetical protein
VFIWIIWLIGLGVELPAYLEVALGFIMLGIAIAGGLGLLAVGYVLVVEIGHKLWRWHHRQE